MSRKGGRDRPPRLDDIAPVVTRSAGPRTLTRRRRIIDAGVAGARGGRGRAEVSNGVRRLVAGDRRVMFGLELDRVTHEEAQAAVDEVWGSPSDGVRTSIDPDRTLAGARVLGERLRDASVHGRRVAFATGRPASMLPMLTRLVSAARAGGAVIAECPHYGPLEPRRHPPRWLWWYDGVAAVTDGEHLLADDGVEAGDEWLFAVGRPDLVVADLGFAGAAAEAGHETIALADLDTPALAVAAARGAPLRLVPLDARRPPAAYAAVVDEALAPPEDQEPHSTTRVRETYAPADSGGEG